MVHDVWLFWVGLLLIVIKELQLRISLRDEVCFEAEKLRLIEAVSANLRDVRTSLNVPLHTEHVRAARSIV